MENLDKLKEVFNTLNYDQKQEALKTLSFENSFTLFTNLNDLIKSGKEFVIPDYQRGYVWEAREVLNKQKKNIPPKKQLDVLWDDLMRLYDEIDKQQNNAHEHYMGMLTFKTNDGKYEIVDGQQRLTTLAILLSVLDSHQNVQTERLKLTYNKQNFEMKRDFEKVLNQDTADVSEKSIYELNLLQAKKFFQDKLGDTFKKDKSKLRDIILNNLTFNILFNDDSVQASVIFETINNRGKGLTKLEILKNRVFFLLKRADSATSSDSEFYNEILDCWKEIFKNLGIAQASIDARKDIINDDNFLQAWGFLEFDGLNIKEKYQVEAILEKFALSNETWTEHALKKVMMRMEYFSKRWKDLFNPSDNKALPPKLKNLYERLCHIGLDKWEMSCVVGLGYCLLSLSYVDELVLFLNLFEKFLFCHTYMYFGLSRDTSFLVGPVKELYKKKIALDNKKLSQDNYKKDVCKTLVELAEKICGKQGYEKKDCLANILSTDNINSWAAKLSARGFYNWNGISYFLFDEANTPGIQKISWRDAADKKATIEHIFPQTPNKDWEGLFDESDCDIDKAKQALGNLLPLSFNTNEKVKNKNFYFKKLIYEQDSASAMSFCSEYDFWDLNNLLYRTNEQLQVIYDNWLNPEVVLKDFENNFGGNYDVNLTQADFDKCKSSILNAILKKSKIEKLDTLSKHVFAKLKPTLREKQENLIVSLYSTNCKSYGSRIKNGGNILIVIKKQDELKKLLADAKYLSKDEKNAEKDKYNREAEKIAEYMSLSGYKKRTLVLPSDLLQDKERCLEVVKTLLPDFSQPANITVHADDPQIEKYLNKEFKKTP